MMGKAVTVKGNVWLYNEVAIGDYRAYWYNIADQTGQIVIKSEKKLPEGEKTVHGEVRRIRTGRIYIQFKKFL
jgi:hypothetical protein